MSTTTEVSTRRRSLLAGTVGNFVEWYEFGAYGFFATVIAANFFSSTSTSDAESLIKTYASFALAFFFRPIGAAIFGRVGDRIGRRPTLIIVLLLMTASTALIGLLPTYATVGAAAPWLLTLVRALQGLSAGGEFGGAVSIMTEFAPKSKRGLYGAWQSLTVALGLLAGAGLAAILATVLSAQALHDWGWRVPFLVALPLGLVALLLRLKLEETPSFTRVQEEPPPAAPGEVARAIVLGICRLMGWSAAGYTFLVVMPSYLQSTLDATFRQALVATVLANAGFALSIMPAGWLSDKIGRRPVMVTGAGLVVVLAFPLLNLLQDKEAGLAAKGAAVFVAGLVVGLMAGPGPAMLAEMFPTRARYTGLGLAYSLSNAVFSGSAGLIITELIKRTKNIDIPAWYVVVTCAVSVVALLTLRGDDHRRELRD
ncbi:MFS transporter [Kribbella solani]|uniref:Putative proline/betaine transporter n=1 Tax=Kribbella solani TaxID=236067 RepID=A0A841DZL1_9ACTN|nr:MFS transporter [Kribbella solani]MBB5982205.1 MFS family permease [Kribbella solani]MDX2968202.1 MFS transporter [Kribbella solani]MDX3003933.1 MFS transporter [Kribbella solani]